MLSSCCAAVPAMCQLSPGVRDGRGCSEAGHIDMAMVHQPQWNRTHSSVSVFKNCFFGFAHKEEVICYISFGSDRSPGLWMLRIAVVFVISLFPCIFRLKQLHQSLEQKHAATESFKETYETSCVDISLWFNDVVMTCRGNDPWRELIWSNELGSAICWG